MTMPLAGVLASLLLAAPASAGQSSISVPDPGGGTPWSARLTESGGRTCVQLARGADRRPRECARLSSTRSLSRVFMYSVRVETAPDPQQSRTIALAVFANSVVRARLDTPDGAVTFRRGRRRGPGIALVVMAGRVERPALRVEVRRRGGRIVVLRNAPPTGLQVADPQGGPAWRTTAFAESGERACVRWERVPGRFEPATPPLRGALRCGPGGAEIPVATAQVVDGRVVVLGLAGGESSGFVLLGPGIQLSLAVDRRSRAFLAILPGTTDPAALRIRYRTPSGSTSERVVDPVGR
jgi:hypothetical protein